MFATLSVCIFYMFNKSSIIYEIFSIPLQYSTCVCFIYFNSSHKHIFFFMAFCNMNEAKKTKMLIFKLLRGFFFSRRSIRYGHCRRGYYRYCKYSRPQLCYGQKKLIYSREKAYDYCVIWNSYFVQCVIYNLLINITKDFI